ncbi:MAG: response regulator [Lachnospiraceae bacterium]|nr:response regulator [bacterium]MDY5516240.1 response regulator [Lachnospiraceae bacterium]
MKKIFLIGKFNVIMQNIYQVMTKQFDMQICPADYEIIEGMFQMIRPEMILISTMDFAPKDVQIYELIAKKYSWIPVLSIGKKDELRMLYDHTQTEQFHEVFRPVRLSEVIRRVNEILGIKTEEYVGKEDVANVKNGPKTILLIDDSPVQLRQVREILKDKYHVIMAPSGLQAMSILTREKPDLIFLDYDMPVVDGKMVLEEIRANEQSRDIPVVFLTAINSKEKILAVAPLNPSDYLLKPVNAKRILETAQRITG